MLKVLFFVLVSVFSIQFVGAQSFNYNHSSGALGTTYSWIDCTSGGQTISFTANDDGTDEFDDINWPFAFKFYDTDYTTANKLSVCTNGFIRLNGIADNDPNNASSYVLNSGGTSLGQIIALGVYDCRVTNAYYKETGSAPNRVFTVQYSDLEINWNASEYVDIQVSFYETSNKVVIKVGSNGVSQTDAEIGIHSATAGYYHKWQDIDVPTTGENVWIEYTVPPTNYYTTVDGNIGTTYSWIDCSSGTEIQDSEWLQDEGRGDKKDDGYAEIAWPFDFQVYESNYFAGENMYFCTNGFIRFDDVSNDDAANTFNNDIDSYSPNLGEIVAFALEDAGLVDSKSTVYYLTTGSAPNRIFTFEIQDLEVRYSQGKYMDVQISFYETSNKIVIKVGSFDVDPASTTYLGVHSGATYKNQWGELQAIGENKWREHTPPAKAYSNIIVTQASTADLYPSEDNELLRVQFDITGGGGAFNLTDLDITASNNSNADVGNVKLYHTSESTFSTDHQVGSAVTVSGGKYTFSGLGYNMPGGTSYIWVTYDITSSAFSGNYVDGYIATNDITLNGVNYPSSSADPGGDRKINYIEWDGSSNAYWTVGANWTGNTVPSPSDNVVIPSGTPNNPHLRDNKNGYCNDILIKAGASLTVESSSNKNLHIDGNIINNGTFSVTGLYNVLLRGTDNYIKGTGTYPTAKFRLYGDNKVYTLKDNISIYRFDIYSADNNCTLNINDKNLVCSNRLRNESNNSTINITTGSASVSGSVVNNGTLNNGKGTFYYSGSNSQTILNETYHNLKIKVSTGTRVLNNVSSNCKSLEIVGSGTAELAASIDIDENLKIGVGSILDLNGDDIELSGDFTNNGTLTSGTQTVTFDGKGSSHIYGNTNFYNLTISKSTGDVYSDGSNHITNTLALTRGVLYSSSATSIIIDAGANYSGGTNTISYIIGPMRKDGNTNFKFPIGGFRKFAPCELTNLGGSTEFTAEYKKSGHSNSTSYDVPLTKVSLNEYWNITPSPAVNADVKLYWLDGSWSGIGDLGDLRLAHYNGTKWEELSGASTGGDVNSGSITKLGVSSFSPFTFGTTDNTTNPLPVSLLSFDATKVDNTALLEWQTASEINNDFFIIQRSVNGVEIEDIAKVYGNGKSNSLLSYSFVDNNPPSGTVYYRLKQVDFDGKYEVFNWKVLDFSGGIYINVYPNPNTNGVLHIASNINSNATVEIYSIEGKLVKTLDLDINSGEISVNHNLKNGCYFIKIYHDNLVETQKLIVQ